MEAQKVCGTHGGRAPQSKAKARRIIDEAQDKAAHKLLGIAESAENEAVKLAAVKHILALGGFNEKTAVEVSVRQQAPWEEMVEGLAPISRAESRAARGLPAEPRALEPGPAESEPIEAEVVYDRRTGPPPWAEDASAGSDLGNAPTEPRNGYMTWDEAQDEIARDSRAHNMRGTHIREIGM
jgi:hypothetical protein